MDHQKPVPKITKDEEMAEDGDDERGETSEERLTEEELEALVKTEPVKFCVCSSDDEGDSRAKSKPAQDQSRRRGGEQCCLTKKNRCCCCRWQCLLTMALVSFLSLMAVLAWMDSFIQESVINGLVMQEGTPKDEMWRTAKVPALYTVRIFNLTNPSQFMAGDPPRVVETGPYVYQYRELKEKVQYNTDGTVRYQGRPLYSFQPHLSEGREEDVVTTVNIPFVNAAEMVKNVKVVKTIMKVLKKVNDFDTIRTVTVKELLWGHRSRVLDWARSMHQDVPYPHKEFGLLMGLNNSLQPPYVMHTGLNDPSRMNQIVTWKGKQLLDFWFGTECNAIKGTDANGFSPGLSKDDKLFIFNGQLCRTLSLVYNSTVNRQGLEAYRFTPPDEIFSYGPEAPENLCYCGKEGCPLNGLVDMKPCYFGAAVAFSFPHFYTGYPKLWHAVKGLRPDPTKHRTEFDIYPDLGVPLRVKLRMQMNVMLDRNQALERARHYDLVLPIFWFEVGIDSLPGEVVGLLKLAQNLPPVVKTTSVTLCTALTIIFLILLLAQTVAAWCGWRATHDDEEDDEDEERRRTPEPPYVDHHPHHPYMTPPPWDYEGLHKPRRGGSTTSSSLASTLPPPGLDLPIIDDHTLLPPYRRRNNLDLPDAPPQEPDEPVAVDQVPPPYSPGPPQRTPSTVSVEIHTTVSDDDLPDLPCDPPVTKVAPLQCSSPDYPALIEPPPEAVEEKDEQEDSSNEQSPPEPERVTPSTPPPLPGEEVVAPLAGIEDTKDIDVSSGGVPSPLSSPRTATEPLATSSPHGSSSIGNGDSRGHLPPPLESDL